jgi:hypothetical protein
MRWIFAIAFGALCACLLRAGDPGKPVDQVQPAADQVICKNGICTVSEVATQVKVSDPAPAGWHWELVRDTPVTAQGGQAAVLYVRTGDQVGLLGRIFHRRSRH